MEKDERMAKTNEVSILFAPVKIGRAEIPNRFVRSATHEYMAEEDGTVTERQIGLFQRLAEGEVGLIITGHAYVNPNGKAGPRQTSISADRDIEGLGRIPRAVHAYPARIFIQLAHAGRQTKVKLAGGTPISPSPVFEPTVKLMPREMTGEDIVRTIDDFVQAGRRAKEAGFDGAQLHMAHGYLLSSFLSPHANRRTDEWGGDIGNRVRIALEIVRGIQTVNGKDFPLIVKLNATDFMETGLHLEEAIQIAVILESAGIHGIEVSGGMAEAGKGSVWQGLRREDEEGYFVPYAAAVKKAVGVPVFGLGGNRTFAMMERFVKSGKVDLISLSRPLIRDPDLVKKFRAGEIAMSDCVSCNKCFNPRGIACAQTKGTA